MIHSDFEIGADFICGKRRWRCTDKGTRTIAAICVDEAPDPSWLIGPTYALAETVFDEDDMPGCTPAIP
jgi:hypothetical protein